MNSDTKNDLQLISAIQAGGQERERSLAVIYRNEVLRRKVCNYIKSRGGNHQDGEDMFQEAIIVLDRNIRQDKFRNESSLEAYLFSICKFLWMNQMRKNKRISLVEDPVKMDAQDLETPESIILNDEQKEVLNVLMDKLGEKCKKVLRLWQLSYSMKEIAEQVGLSSEGMARKTKYQCIRKMMDLINEDPRAQGMFKQ